MELEGQKIVKKILLILLLLPSIVFGAEGVVWEHVEDFMNGVRTQVHSTATTQVSNADLHTICMRALIFTSIDIGGVEAYYMINTDTGQAFYEINTSIVEVLHASLIDENQTFTIKAWYPEFYDKYGGAEMLDESAGDHPLVYNYWDDTLQLIPIPTGYDSLYLKCYIKHSAGAATDSATTDVELETGFAEAALFYACAIRQMKIRKFDEAKFYMELYGMLKVSLKEAYRRKWNIIMPQGEEQ